MKFHVHGVKCSRCVEKIEALQTQISDVQSLRFNMLNHELRVELGTSQGSFAKVIQAIEDKGFRLTPIASTQDLVELNKKEYQRELFRLALTGFCAGNIMMFSFANYFGAGKDFSFLFSWLSFGLYLPVLLFSALPFYQGFYSSLKARQLSVDGPLTVASIGGFLFSTFHLFQGSELIYFDSLSGFLFLIMLSRFLQRQLQRRFLGFRGNMPIDSFSRARVICQGETVWRPTAALNRGDHLLLKENEVLPVDARLLDPQAFFSTAYLNGESSTLIRLADSVVQAGSILKSSEVKLEVLRLAPETAFGKLIQQVAGQETLSGRAKIQDLADRWTQILLVSVFSIAGVFILANAQNNLSMALERALALIVLACPCAMAFGTPLALSFSLRNAFRKGFLIRHPDVFEKITQVRNVIFDKTGTLTGQKISIHKILPNEISQEKIDLILSLENISSSLYAEAFRDYFKNSAKHIFNLIDHTETPGQGVSGYYQGNLYQIKSSASDSNEKCVALYINGVADCQFSLRDELDVSAIQLSKNLRARGLQQFILSGDSSDQVQGIAKQLNIPASHTFARATPAEKAEKVKLISHSMMVGDGVNDALAFQAALVGIAVQGSVEMALRSADIYLLSPDIKNIGDLFEISHRALKLIKGNLWISLVYNLLGGVAALLGYINPLTAALLMPASSGFILLSTWLRSRE
jgi:Cu2+-exporting ATPase/Cu+-exporting ATPase